MLQLPWSLPSCDAITFLSHACLHSNVQQAHSNRVRGRFVSIETNKLRGQIMLQQRSCDNKFNYDVTLFVNLDCEESKAAIAS